MLEKTAILALCALLLTGCAGGRNAPAPEAAAATAAPTPAIYAVGSSEGNETLVLAAPTAPNTPAPVGKVEYHAEEGAHYEILSDKTVSVTGGPVEIIIDGMAFSGGVRTSEGGSVRLHMTNGASFTGALTCESMLDVSVSMDEKSTWTLTADVRVDALVNGDESFQNIVSNGHSVSYHCENGENAYLARASLTLPGGGKLLPVI